MTELTPDTTIKREISMEKLPTFVFVYRKLLNSAVFKSPELLQLWMYCMLRANHDDNEWDVVLTGRGTTTVPIKRGQFAFGRHQAAKDLKQNPSSIYKRMKKLEKLGNLTIQSNTHYSIVTICNWDYYQREIPDMWRKHQQQKEQAREQASNNQVTSKEQPSNTNKNDKNVKKGIIYIPVHDESIEIVDNYHYAVGQVFPRRVHDLDGDLKACDNLIKKYGSDVVSKTLKWVIKHQEGKFRWINNMRSVAKFWRKPDTDAHRDYSKWMDAFIDKMKGDRSAVTNPFKQI